MVQVKYLGTIDERVISEDDFAAIPSGLGGPLDHETVTWDSENMHVADVKDEIAKWLERSYPRDFKRLNKKEAAEHKKAVEAQMTAQLMPEQEAEEAAEDGSA